MPNWCMDCVTFYPKEAGQLGKLEQLRQDLNQALATIEVGAENWIGRLLVYKGMPIEKAEDRNVIDCRGFVSDKDASADDTERFEIIVDSAWSPIEEMYDWMAKTYDLEYVYIAEEGGTGLFINTDVEGKFYTDRYYISHDDVADPYCETLEQVIETLKSELGLPVMSDMILEQLNELDEDLTIYEFDTSATE